MRINRNKGIFLNMAVVFILLCLVGCKPFGGGDDNNSPAEPSKVKAISFTASGNPGNNSVYLEKVSTNGDEITLDIKVKGGTDVYDAALEINYDSSKISYVSSLKGDYLGANIYYLANLYNSQQGILLIGTGKKGNVLGANGDGSLCTVVFKALVVQTGNPIQFNNTNSCLNSPSSNISGTIWLGGTLSYQ